MIWIHSKIREACPTKKNNQLQVSLCILIHYTSKRQQLAFSMLSGTNLTLSTTTSRRCIKAYQLGLIIDKEPMQT